MLNFLKLLFKNNITEDSIRDAASREACGTFAGVFGIISNLLLFALKLTVGLMSGSISIIADAVNNLADSGSSILTIVGFKLSSKPADEDHPYGHARMEYLTGLGISVIILIIGFELLSSSASKIFSPELPDFSTITFVILVISIFIKLFQGLFYRRVGKMIHSETLMAAFTDSINDVISTVAVLCSTVIAYMSGIVLDGFIGIAVSLFIMFSGIKTVIETSNPLIGTAPDAELVGRIGEKLQSYPIVLGIHDLVVHSYGAEKCFASVHVEIDANADIIDAHDMIDIIERSFMSEMGIVLVIHMDPIVTDSPELDDAKTRILGILADISDEISMHDFRAVFGNAHTNLIFDVCIPYGFRMSEEELKAKISERAAEENPDWYTVVTVDRNMSGGKLK